jgi:hypothetical protein
MPKRKKSATAPDDNELARAVRAATEATKGGGPAAVTDGDNDSDSENEYWHPVQVQAREMQKWDQAVQKLRIAEEKKGRVYVPSAEPQRTEWSCHLAVEGDKYFWHSEKTGSTWDDPRKPCIGEDGSEYLMVLIPERAVPGMLLCVEVPAVKAKSESGAAAEAGPAASSFTPMRVPVGAEPGRVYQIKLERPAAAASTPANSLVEGGGEEEQPASSCEAQPPREQE